MGCGGRSVGHGCGATDWRDDVACRVASCGSATKNGVGRGNDGVATRILA